MTKTNTRSRIVSILLVLMMLLTMVPITGVTASAAEPEWTTVNTYDELKAALSNQNPPDNIKLGSDIDTGTLNSSVGILESLEVKGKKQLDLNGHTLRMYSAKTAMHDMITIRHGDLTVLDSSAGRNGRILGSTYNDSTHLINVMGNGKFTLNSGRLEVDKGSLINESSWKRTIDCRDGGEVTINGGTIYVDPETYEGNNNAYGQYFEKEYGDLVNGHCGFALAATNECKVTINDGTFKGPVRLDAGGGSWKKNELRIQINGGTFENKVMLNDAGDGSVTLTEINGGIFLDYVQAWAVASFENSFSTPEVVINGGEFHKKFWMRPKFPDGNGKNLIGYHVAAKLNGGTFHGTLSVDKNYTDYGSAYVSPRLSYSDVTFLADEMLGKNAVQTGKGTFAAQDTSSYREFISYYNRSERWSEGFVFEIKAVNNQPTTIIPNAWGIKSVTLDGNPIDYFKDWNGTVERMDNSTAHTLKFEWYPLAQELKDAGYTYRTNFDCYTVGSNTPTTSVPISATATEYSHTIPAGEAPSVYPFDLQLNLDKNGSSVGIMSNQHIVKLVVNEAPVVTEISNAPVQLSAALTPGTSAPSAAAVGSGYTVDSINWYTDNNCTKLASSFEAGKAYYGKIVLKSAENYKFAASASALIFCDDPNENYSIVGSSTVAADGSSLTLIVKGKAVSALKWETVNTDDKAYTIGDSALTLNAKAVGGESSKPITYKLIAKKDGTETVKASATVAASSTNAFSASLRFTDTGSYECWFEATRGNVTITSDHFTVTVNAPGLSIANQSGDLTVKQNATARLFVKAVGHGVNYQWQVKNGGAWNAISGETAYDYAAPTTNVGEKTYRCKVTDKYGATKYTNEMTVTVTAVADSSLTPAIPLAAVNGDAPDPAELWPDRDVTPNGWLGLKTEYNVTAGETFHGVATFSTIPTGFNMNGHDIYYDSYNNVQKTPVLGTISYEWEGTTKNPWEATSGDFTSLGTDAHASFTIPSGVDTYYVVLSVTNTVGAQAAKSTVYITFHVSAAHTHTYAYAQLNKDQHTKYCTAGDDSITENHTMENGVCKYCGYAPAKTYSVTVTDGSADHSTNVAPGTKVTLTANTAPSGQEFDKWAGNVTVASDNTFTMPSHNVTVAATYKPIAHTHDTDAQPWVYMDPGTHIKTCTAGDDFKVEAHDFSAWTKVDETTHSRTCSKCKKSGEATNYTETAEHTWVWVVDQEAALGQPGKQHEECTGCHAKRSENTEIPALQDYAVTVTGGTATVAAGTPVTRAMEGVEVTVTAQAPGGRHFVKWVVKAGGVTLANETSATTTFIMPANDVTIEAEFAENPVEAYTLTVINGTASVAAGTPITDKIAQNTVVTVTANAPETGKVFDKWVVLEGNVTLADATKATTTFTMPASAVKIEATYKDAPPSHTHSYGTDWKYDDTNHWHECACGDKADTAAHSFQWVIDKAATKEATGIKHEECTVCGAKRSENTVIDKLPDGGNTGNTGSGDNNTDKPGKDDSTKSPQTGDSSNLIGWLAALFVSGGVLTVLGLNSKKRKESEAE